LQGDLGLAIRVQSIPISFWMMRKRDLLNCEHRRGRLVGRLAGVGGLAPPALWRIHPANGEFDKSQRYWTILCRKAVRSKGRFNKLRSVISGPRNESVFVKQSLCTAKMAPWEFGKGWAEMRGFKRREPEVGGPEPPLIARAACECGKDNSQQNLALGICGNALGHEIS
jgi:hypothetical protein